MGKEIKITEKDGKKITEIKKGIKNNKTENYSYVNAISPILDIYSRIFNDVVANREGCYTAEMFSKINSLLVCDFNNSINNLKYLSKKSMKYLKKKDREERKKIFWYKFRRFFKGKINDEIETLIKKREKYKLEMALMFEDVISSNVRKKVEEPELINDDSTIEDEPDFTDNPDDLVKGPDEHRALHGEVVDEEKLSSSVTGSLEYSEAGEE